MTLTRTQLIGGIITIAIVSIAAYAVWYFAGPSAQYRGLTTTVDRGLDEATKQYFEQRIATTEASIAAEKKNGEDVNLDYYLSIASDAFSLGDLVKAREALEAQLKENPAHYAAWNSYGTVLEEMGDYEGARDAYVEAIDIGGSASEELYRDYLVLLQNHFPEDREQMKAILELSVEQRGQTSWNMVELGRWYQESGDCDQAVAHFEVAKTLAPGNEAITDELAELKRTCK